MDGTPSSYVTFGCHHSRQLALMDMHVQPEGAGTDLHSCMFRDLDIESGACPAGGMVVTALRLGGSTQQFSGLTGDIGALAPLGVHLVTLYMYGQGGITGDVAGLSGLTYLDLRYCRGVTDWPLVTSDGRTFHSANDHTGTYSAADDTACASVSCEAQTFCFHGECQ